MRGRDKRQKWEGCRGGVKEGGLPFISSFSFAMIEWGKKKEAAISRCRRRAECIRMDRKWNSLSLSPFKIMMKNGPHTYILVLAVDVSQSAASPTMSNPVES